MATGKRAIQRLVVGEDGRLRTILIDLMTLEPVVDPTGYYVVNQGETEPEPVPDVDAPDVVHEPGDEAPEPEVSGGGYGRMSPVDTRPSTGYTPSAPAAPRTDPRGASIAKQAIDRAVKAPVGNSTLRTQEAQAPTPTARPEKVGFAGGAVNRPSTPGIDYSQIGHNRPNKVAPEHEGFLSSVAKDVYGKDSKVSVTSGDVDPDQPGWTADGGKYSKSHRHTDELGADVQFDNPHLGATETNTQRIGDLAMAAAARNPTVGIGFGEDYMGDRTMHIDQANKGGVWGGGLTANQKENIGFARQTGIGPTPNYGAPTPTAKPSAAPSFTSQDERVQDRPSVAESVVADAKDVTSKPAAMGFAGSGMNRPTTPGTRVTDKTKSGTTVTDDGYTETSRTGARGWRNNNPGNIRAGDFAMAQGAIGSDFKNDDGQFAVFGSMDEGRKAQAALLGTKTYQDLSIKDAIARYAPPSENDTKRYTREVTDALGLPDDTRMSDLSPSQLDTMVGRMAEVEGSTRPGRETRNQHTYSGSPGTRDRDAPSEKSGGRFGGSGLGYSARGGQDSPSEGARGGFASRSERSTRSTESSGGRGRGGYAAGGNSKASQSGKSESKGGRGRGGFAAGGYKSSKSSPTNDGKGGKKSPGGGF